MTRRRFTAEYKVEILREADACERDGDVLAHMRWIVKTTTTVKGGEEVLAELSKLYPRRSERTFASTGDDLPSAIFATHGSK